MEDVQNFSFCEKCGSKILDGDTICGNCGCETRAAAQQRNTAERKAKTKKRIIIASATVAFLVIAFIAGLFIRNHIRREDIKDKLAGNQYEYENFNSVRYVLRYYSFDEEANCTYYSYNSYDEREVEFTLDYKIEFKGDKVFLDLGETRLLEVQFDSYGDIDSLNDELFDHKYE